MTTLDPDKPIYVAQVPFYIEGLVHAPPLDFFLGLPWEQRTDARRELFMSDAPVEYTYGRGDNARTYGSIPYAAEVRSILDFVNERLRRLSDVYAGDGEWGPMNVCFLNRYDNKKQALGWHADDSPGMRHDRAIAVVSFGEAREIWWRHKGQTGVIPESQRQLLTHGSLFVMPPQFQRNFDHRIPKADRDVGTRISLTFRAYSPPV